MTFRLLAACLIALSALVWAACSPSRVPESDTGTEAVIEEIDAPEAESVIELEYWQYAYGSHVAAMDILIEQFHEQYPNIRIVQYADEPVDRFEEVLAARVPAGLGPDILALTHAWQNPWIKAGYLVPLPQSAFPHATVREEFAPLVEASFVGDDLYTLPMGAQIGGLFYNPALLEEAGLDPGALPATLEDLIAQAVQCTQRNDDGTYEIMGLPLSPQRQAGVWFREVLLRQFGGSPYSEDRRTVTWNADPAGYAAWQQLLAFQTELETGDAAQFDTDLNSFVTGRACFYIDTSFGMEYILANVPDLVFGVTELPAHNDLRTGFGLYWAHGITPKANSTPERAEAAATFLHFITRPEAGRFWAEIVGDLSPHLGDSYQDAMRADPTRRAFWAALPYAHAPFWINEGEERRILAEAYLAVTEEFEDPAAQLDLAVEAVQEFFDRFWANR